MLQVSAYPYLPKAVVDATGLRGGYDFDLHWTWEPRPDCQTIFEAIQKQLGLKLTLEGYPTPVVIVDSVNEKPTPNATGLDRILSPPPPAELDVAVLTPTKPDAKSNFQDTANQITATDLTLKFLISYAWSLNLRDDDLIQNGPKFINQDH